MCECHPWSDAEKKAWVAIQREPRSKDDWTDLHNTIEAYKRRVLARRTLTPQPAKED